MERFSCGNGGASSSMEHGEVLASLILINRLLKDNVVCTVPLMSSHCQHCCLKRIANVSTCFRDFLSLSMLKSHFQVAKFLNT